MQAFGLVRRRQRPTLTSATPALYRPKNLKSDPSRSIASHRSVSQVVKGSNILWTDAELVSAVDAYVFMLQAERVGVSYPKDIDTKLLLSGPLNIRNDASLRYRMRNISAVVDEMGGPILAAYSPAEQVGTNVRTRLRAILANHSHFRAILQETRDKVAYPNAVSADERATLRSRSNYCRPFWCRNPAQRPQALTREALAERGARSSPVSNCPRTLTARPPGRC